MSEDIIIGSDHGGFDLKSVIKKYLNEKQYLINDIGTHSKESCHYPDYAHIVADAVNGNATTKGILICTTGQGMAITANKYPNVRAALCWNKEIAILSRAHNDANILCLPGEFVTIETTVEIIDAFFNTLFNGGRHSERINKIRKG